MNVANLRANLKNNKLENIYLFDGSEIGEKKELTNMLINSIFTNDEPLISTYYFGNDFIAHDFFDNLKTSNLFYPKKLIILKGIEQANADFCKKLFEYIVPQYIEEIKFDKRLDKYYAKKDSTYTIQKIKEADKNKIVSILNDIDLKNYDTDTYLLLINESDDKIPDAITRVLLDSQNIKFYEMFENQKSTWIENKFRQHNAFIQKDAIDFLLDTVENNKDQLETTIAKLIVSYSELHQQSQQKVIDKDFIEKFLYHSKEETPFTLYSALINKQTEKALTILRKLFETDEFGFLNGIMWSHKRMVKAFNFYENEKHSIDEVIRKDLFIKNRKVETEITTGLRNFSFKHSVNALYQLSELEYDMRVLPKELKLVKLELFIVNFINGNIEKSFLQGTLQYLQY